MAIHWEDSLDGIVHEVRVYDDGQFRATMCNWWVWCRGPGRRWYVTACRREGYVHKERSYETLLDSSAAVNCLECLVLS